MLVESVEPREDWRGCLRKDGFWAPTEMANLSFPRNIRWDECKVAHVTERTLNRIVDATRNHYARVISSVGDAIDGNKFDEYGPPAFLMPYLLRSWEEDHPTLLMRFEFEEIRNDPRLISVSSGDLSLLYETADLQWKWKQAALPEARQFNTAYEALIETFEFYGFKDRLLHMASLPIQYHKEQIGYLAHVAEQASVIARQTDISDIGYCADSKSFTDMFGDKIDLLYKMYPWQDLLSDSFANYLNQENLLVIEPPWTLFLEDKAFKERFSGTATSADRISCWTVSGEPAAICVTKVLGDGVTNVETIIPHIID